MNGSGGQGGDGSGNQPPGGVPFTTQPGMGGSAPADPGQNPTVPNQVQPPVNPVPSAHAQTLAGGHSYQPPAGAAHPQSGTAQAQPPADPTQPSMHVPQHHPHQGAYPQQPQANYQSRPHPGLPLTPGHAFVRMIVRAFTLHMGHDKVLPNEAAQLNAVGITHPDTQGFLAWRRSILLVVGVLMLPFVTVQAVKTFKDVNDNTPGVLTAMWTFHIMINFAFAGLCFFMLAHWRDWQKQRRLLMLGWLVFFVMPFAIFLIPVRELFTTDDHIRTMAGNPNLAGQALAAAKERVGATIGLIFMLQASMVLAPKAVSLMPGIVRAALAAKLKFPGAPSPGWLIALLSPLYALLVYVVLIGPYQLTGSGWVLMALAGFIGGPLWLAAGGIRVARPLSEVDADVLMKRARIGYLTFTLCGVGFLFIAFLQIEQFKSGWWIARMMLSLGTNVLLLTLIATDLMFTALNRARLSGNDPNADALERGYEHGLAAMLAGTTPQQPGQQPPPPQQGYGRAPSYHDGPVQGSLDTIKRPGDENSWS